MDNRLFIGKRIQIEFLRQKNPIFRRNTLCISREIGEFLAQKSI